MLPKGEEKPKKVHYELGDGYAKTMKVSNIQRAATQKKRFNIIVTGSEKHAKLKQKTAIVQDRRSKNGLKVSKGGLSARRTTFAADVQEEVRDDSSGDGGKRAQPGSSFLTDLPEEVAGNAKKKQTERDKVLAKSKPGPTTLEQRSSKNVATEAQLQVVKKGNPQIHSLNSLHQIARKFSKE